MGSDGVRLRVAQHPEPAAPHGTESTELVYQIFEPRSLPRPSSQAACASSDRAVQLVDDHPGEAETAPAPGALPARLERELIAILVGPAEPGETIEAAFRRKERELATAFDALSPLEARAVHGRLTAARPGDPLATQFGRLVHARRQRLLDFLASARRRVHRTPPRKDNS